MRYIRTMRTKWMLPGLMLLAACASNEPQFPVEPQIEFVSISPAVIKDNVTSFDITIKYKDGDGDLGYEDKYASERTGADLVLLDLRPEVADPNDEYDGIWEYNLPNLTPESRNLSIQGEITLNFPALPLKLDPLKPEEKLSFDVYVIDRAGHKSNVITTSEITVTE